MAWLDRLKAGLNRTRVGLTDSLGQALLGNRRPDMNAREALEETLIAADVGGHLAAEIVEEWVEGLRKNDREALDVLKELLGVRLAGCERPLRLRSDGSPTVILMTGVNGAGKTTTIAKIAAHLREESPDIPLTFAAADTFRAAAVEQLSVWAERIDADLIKHRPGSDPSAVVFDAIDHAIRIGGALFVDTAGRLQTKHNLMEELKKIERTVTKRLGRGSDERLLVLDATTGQNGVSQAERFHEAIGLTGIVLTKLDSTAKGGVVLAIGDRLNIPLMFVGVGETMEDLHPFSADEFVEALFTRSGETNGNHTEVDDG